MSKGRLDFEGDAMRRGPKVEPIVLTTEENSRLVEWTRRHKTSQAIALRARIVLACQQDRSNREVAGQLRITPQTVGKWRGRFQGA
jgi:DNA-binding CsgD family transcriptional regulator